MPFIMGSVTELKKQIDEIQARIKAIQEKCSHPEEAVEMKHGSNTGNYDPSCDSYWTDFHCHLCDKKWTLFKDHHGIPYTTEDGKITAVTVINSGPR